MDMEITRPLRHGSFSSNQEINMKELSDLMSKLSFRSPQRHGHACAPSNQEISMVEISDHISELSVTKMGMEIASPLYHQHRQGHGCASASSNQETSMENLPEDVILNIMSKLMLRDVVNFSIVSKQWAHIPASLNRIILDSRMSKMGDQLCPGGRDAFVKGVNQFLLHYNKLRSMVALPASLSSLSITFCLNRVSSADIDRWISEAVFNGVTSLSIHLQCKIHAFKIRKHRDEKYIFPWQLMNKSPVVLKTLLLRSCIFGCCLTSKWTSLESLTLCDAVVTEYDVNRICHCFPNLQRLILNSCEVPAKLTLEGGALTYLWVQNCIGLEEIEVLRGSTLAEFIYKGRYCVFNFTGAHKLTDISFRMTDAEVVKYVLQDVHRDFPAMKSLSLFRFRESKPTLSHLRVQMRSFRQLEELKLYCHLDGEFSISTMKEVLKACPELRRLEIIPPCMLDAVAENVIESPVQHLHKCLRFIKIIGFCGSLGNMEVTKFLVQASEALHLVVIEQEVEVLDGMYEKHSGSWHGEQPPKAVKDYLLKLLKSSRLNFCQANH